MFRVGCCLLVVRCVVCVVCCGCGLALGVVVCCSCCSLLAVLFWCLSFVDKRSL